MPNRVDFGNSGLIGIDTTNLITTISYADNVGWTATQDCWVVSHNNVLGNGTFASVIIDGVMVALCHINSGTSKQGFLPFPVKKGQTVTTQDNGMLYVYGLKL